MSMHREDWDRYFQDATTWSSTHRQVVLYAAIALIAFVLGAYSCSSKAATVNIPACDTLTVTSQTASQVVLACGHTPVTPGPAPTPPSACTLPQINLSVGPAGSSTWTSGWNGGNVLVVSFVAPASGRGRLQLSNGGPPYDMRSATLSTSPCGPKMSLSNSQTPSADMQAGGTAKPYGPILLTPGVRYYWAVYNRNPDGSNSCSVGACDMRVDFSAFK